ncbi:hypothetical protein KJ632_04935 [Patescibacteria group bacterium]|nr:hypothetical protein [Patescibacteria group bacterium]
MENKLLIDLGVKYGLSDEDVSKIANIVYQLGYHDLGSAKVQKVAHLIAASSLWEKPMEELIDELIRKGYGPKED